MSFRVNPFIAIVALSYGSSVRGTGSADRQFFSPIVRKRCMASSMVARLMNQPKPLPLVVVREVRYTG